MDTILLALALTASSAALRQPGEADLLLSGGRIITVDEVFSIHSAMAVRDGLVLAVGNRDQLQDYVGNSTRVVDLQGKTVMPGLMDSHSHAASASVFESDHPVPEMRSIAEVLDYVRSRARVVEPGQGIWVSQVFLTRLEEERYPTRQELDGAAPQHPVVFRTGPDASLNSLALKLSGIDESWKVDDGGPGYAEKDPSTGRLTGVLRSSTRYIRVERAESRPSLQEQERRLKELLADYNRVGITSLAERGADESLVGLYQGLRDRGELTARVYMSRRIDTLKPIEEIQATIEEMARSPLYEGDSMLRVAAIKTFLDGGMLTGSAYMLQPWGVSKLYGISDPDYRGLRFFPQEKLVQIMAVCMKNKVQFTAHSVGDGAVHAFIDGAEALRDQFDIRARRPVICHSNFMSEQSVQRMSELGVLADIQPAWLYLDGRTLKGHFGDDRLRWFQPLRALFAAGVIAGGGSDHMQKIGARRSINFYDPWMGMWVAMTRNARWLDSPLHPEHALSRVEAIRFYTINNAYLMFSERKMGSLRPGKWADFIILDTDPLTCSLEEFKEMKVDETYLAGKRVYSRNQ